MWTRLPAIRLLPKRIPVSSRWMSQEHPTSFVEEGTHDSTRGPMRLEKSVNSVTLLGRVGSNPQIRGTLDKPVTTFPLATHNVVKTDTEMRRHTSWHNIAVFKGSLQEVVQKHVSKGNRVYVEGRILYGVVEDQSGNKRHTTTIVADEIIGISE